jgi:hypothetical protein
LRSISGLFVLNFFEKLSNNIRFEWALLVYHIIKSNTACPDIWFPPFITSANACFRTVIIVGTCWCLHFIWTIFHNKTYSEIRKFYIVLFINKDVFRFYISVNYVSIFMTIFNCRDQLPKIFPALVFIHRKSFFIFSNYSLL